jgi:hypothetical protein
MSISLRGDVMYHPAHIDGRSVVILRSDRWGYSALEIGILSYDGRALSLGEGESQRALSDDELQSLMPVAPGNRIPECRGFDFYLIAKVGAST